MPRFFGARVIEQRTIDFIVEDGQAEWMNDKITSSEILEVWDDSGRQHYPGSTEYELVARAIEG
jgi:hypothetical protein